MNNRKNLENDIVKKRIVMAKILENNYFKCLEYVRTAPGKVYQYELYPFLNIADNEKCNENIVTSINSFFKIEFLKSESSASESRLNVIYTNPEYRIILDILLEEKGAFSIAKSVYIESAEVSDIRDDSTVSILYKYRDISNLFCDKSENNLIKEALERYGKWESEDNKYVIDNERFAEKYNESLTCNKGKIDLSGFYLKDIDINVVNSIYNKKYNNSDKIKLINFVAENSVFDGDIIFDEAHFEGGVSFKGSIFKGDKLSFKRAKFDLNGLCADGRSPGEVTFRDTRITNKMILFDDAVIEGDVNDKRLSFEDAVIDSTYISFSKMNLNNVKLFCYQTIMKDACVYMVEPQLSDSYMEFEDSSVDEIRISNAVSIPDAVFDFRFCNKLIIENCNINNNLYINNIDILSLKGCSIQGTILTNWKKRERDKKYKIKSFPILNAIARNDDSNISKSEQFIRLKDNFSGIGQYEYEDEAFILFMKYKTMNSPFRIIYRILDGIGQYGISPSKVLMSMLCTVAFFALLFFGCSFVITDMFTDMFPDGANFYQRIGCSLYMSASYLISYDCTVEVKNIFLITASMTETLIGWFLLGYLSVAVARKTLR